MPEPPLGQVSPGGADSALDGAGPTPAPPAGVTAPDGRWGPGAGAASVARGTPLPRGRLLLLIYGPAVVLIGLTLAFAEWKHLDVGVLTRDPTQVLDALPYVGAFAQVTMLIWGAAATVCLFTALLLWRAGAPPRERNYVLCAGLLTALLVADDALMLHERILPILLGIGESPTYAAYVLLTIALFVWFRDVVRRTPVWLLFAALAWFAVGAIVDLTDPVSLLPQYYLWEDGPKLLGIVTWLGYFTTVCLIFLERL
jgi:hypothetical protein